MRNRAGVLHRSADQDDEASSILNSAFIVEYIPGTDGLAGTAGEQQGQVFH